MTSTSPEFLPAGEDLSAALKNITHSCAYELCVSLYMALVWEQILVEWVYTLEILTVRGSGQ